MNLLGGAGLSLIQQMTRICVRYHNDTVRDRCSMPEFVLTGLSYCYYKLFQILALDDRALDL